VRYNFEKILPEPNQSFRTHDEVGKVIDCNFHVHPEYELTYIVSSWGTRFVGDSIDRFDAGDLALIGPMVPHHYYNSFQDSQSDEWGHAWVVQFKDDFNGISLFAVSELRPIQRMLEAAKYGLGFSDDTVRRARPLLMRLFSAVGPKRIILLLRLLDILADSDYRRLSTVSGDEARIPDADHRINEVLDYIHKSLDRGQSPTLAQTAKKAGMTPEAFSRYFSKTTFKCFIDYINEVKIGKACHLLLNTDKTVVEICFESGFTNLSNFNRHFLKIKKISPRELRRQFLRFNP